MTELRSSLYSINESVETNNNTKRRSIHGKRLLSSKSLSYISCDK